ncbi:WD40-repeat-containing domain protein [Glomus cerebriforme]|uniref:WD40-repeat-containing domain protein n=1 Tax=Glomus cerebriforme TaxID=658196 RepID=A0A397TDV0_9GLOM|nr:WD40-repeat-containing domain protein [Glomus cerebriforme]
MAYRLPFTKLLHHPTKNLLILVFGSQFHALDTSTGALISTTRTLISFTSSTNDDSVNNTTTTVINNDSSSNSIHIIPSTNIHQATIRTLAFYDRVDSNTSIPTLLATSDENKILKVWNCDEWRLRNTRPVSKRAMAMAFNKDGSQIIIADKFGDVYSHPLDPPEDKQNASTLLLGHVSMVTDMVITPNNKYVITCDRDEHIRISRFPKGYNIESYCLGHKQFVSKLHILPWANDLLLSAGGDDFIALWDYVPGKLLQTLNIKEIIETKENYDKKAMNVDSEDSIAVTSITSSPISQNIALTIEKFPGILIFNWDETEKQIRYLQTLHLSIDPLDLAYDIGGNLWVSNYVKEEQPNESLITVFRKSDNKYEKVPEDHPLIKQINEYGSTTVEKIPDLYTISHLRKNLVDWREQDDDDDDEQNVEEEGKNTSKRRKSQGAKKNKKKSKN